MHWIYLLVVHEIYRETWVVYIIFNITSCYVNLCMATEIRMFGKYSCNPFMHNVENGQTYLKHGVCEYLKILRYVWPFFGIMHERLSKQLFKLWTKIGEEHQSTSFHCLLLMTLGRCFSNFFMFFSKEILEGNTLLTSTVKTLEQSLREKLPKRICSCSVFSRPWT